MTLICTGRVLHASIHFHSCDVLLRECSKIEAALCPFYQLRDFLLIVQHEVVRQLLACLSHVGVQSRVLQATILKGSRATRPDQLAERLVSHFRKESRAESPKPLPSLPDIPEEGQEADDSQDLAEEDIQVPAAQPQTPPKQSANMVRPQFTAS